MKYIVLSILLMFTTATMAQVQLPRPWDPFKWFDITDVLAEFWEETCMGLGGEYVQEDWSIGSASGNWRCKFEKTPK